TNVLRAAKRDEDAEPRLDLDGDLVAVAAVATVDPRVFDDLAHVTGDGLELDVRRRPLDCLDLDPADGQLEVETKRARRLVGRRAHQMMCRTLAQWISPRTRSRCERSPGPRYTEIG